MTAISRMLANRNLNRLSRVTANTAWNLAGYGVPSLIGLVTIPAVIHSFGPERFAVLSVVWLILGYATALDLGLGRGTTRLVAEANAPEDKDRLPRIVTTGVISQLVMGSAWGLVFIAASTWLARFAFHLPTTLSREVSAVFTLLGVGFPFVQLTSGLRGVLEGKENFRTVNVVKIPASSLAFVLPWLCSIWHATLPTTVALMLFARVIVACVYGVCCYRAMPGLVIRPVWDGQVFRALLSFGGWVTVSIATGQAGLLIERFIVSALLSAQQLAYYTVPLEVVTRLTILPLSLAATLFPLASRTLKSRTLQAGYLLDIPIKILVKLFVPLAVILDCFGATLLELWVGQKYAASAAGVFRILAYWVCVNSVSYIPFTLIQAQGRPRDKAIVDLGLLVATIALAAAFVPRFGIVGMASIKVVVQLVDLLVMLWLIQRRAIISIPLLQQSTIRLIGCAVVYCVLVRYAAMSMSSSAWRVVFLGAMTSAWFLGGAGWDRCCRRLGVVRRSGVSLDDQVPLFRWFRSPTDVRW